MKKNLISPDRVITLICVVIAIALSVTACAGAAQPVSAAQETVPAVDYETAYNDLLTAYNDTTARIEASEAGYQSRIDELTLALEQEKQNTAWAQEACDQAQAERDQTLEQMEALKQKYSVQYIVMFEARRKIIFPASEEIVRITVPVTEEEYSRFLEGSEVNQVLPCLSVPSDGFNVDWSVTVADTYISTRNIPE